VQRLAAAVSSLKYLAMPQRAYVRQKLDTIPETQDSCRFSLNPEINIHLFAHIGKISHEPGVQADRVIATSNEFPRSFIVVVEHAQGKAIRELILDTHPGRIIKPLPQKPSSQRAITVLLQHPSQLLTLKIDVTSRVYEWTFRYLTTDEYCAENV